MVTFSDLRKLNIGWSDDDIVEVFSLAHFVLDSDCEPERLKVRFAMVMYGDSPVRYFSSNTVWIS